jgi:hypothetical protein
MSTVPFYKVKSSGGGGGGPVTPPTITADSIIADWNTAEAIVCVIGAAGTNYNVLSALVNISNLVGIITLRMYILVNGTLRQIFPANTAMTFNPSAGDAPGVPIINSHFGIANELTITAQSDDIADNGAAIDFEYMLEAL